MSSKLRPRAMLTQLTLAAALLGAWVGAAQGTASDRVPALLRTQNVNLRVIYPDLQMRCEEFAIRLTAVLHAVGAKLEEASALDCPERFSSTIRGRLVVTSPFVADAANIERAKAQITGADRLLAHVRGLPDPDSLEVFPAEWRAITGSHPSLRRLDAADCALLKAIVQQILPQLSVKDARTSSWCRARHKPPFSAVALIQVGPPEGD